MKGFLTEIKRWESGGNQGRVWDMFQGEELATETLPVKENPRVFRSQGEVRSAQTDVKGVKGCEMDGKGCH